MNTSSEFDGEGPQHPALNLDIRHLSSEQFTSLGVSQIAYVKPIVLNGAKAWAIHGADGTPMAVAGDETVAMAAILQHEMAAMLVH